MKKKLLLLQISLFLLASNIYAEANRFAFLGDTELAYEKKISRLEYYRNNTEVSEEEVSFLKKLFNDLDYRILEDVYGLICEKNQAPFEMAQLLLSRIEKEKDFKTLDWLINAYVGNLLKEAREKGNLKTAYVLIYDKLIEILEMGDKKYKEHYILGNADQLFVHALASRKIESLQTYMEQGIKAAKTEDSIVPFLKLATIFAGKFGLSDETKKILKGKLSSPELSKCSSEIEKILAIKNARLERQYPELSKLSNTDLATVLGDQKNPVLKRKEALYELTKKFKWRLFSANESDSKISELLINIISDKSEVREVRIEVLTRLALESKVLREENEILRNEKLVLNTVEILISQKNNELLSHFTNTLPEGQFTRPAIFEYLNSRLTDDKCDLESRSVIILSLSQFDFVEKNKIYSYISSLFQYGNGVSKGSMEYIVPALLLKSNYNLDEIKARFSNLTEPNKKRLFEAIDSAIKR